MKTLRLATIAGAEDDQSHLVIAEDESGERTILTAKASLDTARIYCEVLIDNVEGFQAGFPEKKTRGVAEAK
jgi:hypothetical protein